MPIADSASNNERSGRHSVRLVGITCWRKFLCQLMCQIICVPISAQCNGRQFSMNDSIQIANHMFAVRTCYRSEFFLFFVWQRKFRCTVHTQTQRMQLRQQRKNSTQNDFFLLFESFNFYKPHCFACARLNNYCRFEMKSLEILLPIFLSLSSFSESK